MQKVVKDAYMMVYESEKELTKEYKAIDENAFYNSARVLGAFQEYNVVETDFQGTTGYGYNDVGRDKIEKIFARVTASEDALVRTQIISGTHALTITLFGLLRPGDTFLSITGTPYDTLHAVIGIKECDSSLVSHGVNYEEVDLINNDFDYDSIREKLTNKKYKLVTIQRSKGYSSRESLTIEKIEKVCNLIKEIDSNIIIMVDNCYCEFVQRKFPTEVGADIIVGSLIKNLGGGIAPCGGYVAGKENLIRLVAERLNVPGQGKEVGPSLGYNKEVLLGLYHAPHAVASALKTAVLTAYLLERLGYEVSPKYYEVRADIVQTITFKTKEELIDYVGSIQSGSAIDSEAMPIPTAMPGYTDQIIMASGSFIQGSSIEISCDGPLRYPYIAFQQGSITYEYGKLAIMMAISRIIK